jgi:hypothetical protein
MQDKLGKDVPGQLGLFHFNQRIIGCMRPSHTDFSEALTELLLCIYDYHEEDWNGLVASLKNGTMNGETYDDEQIECMRVHGDIRERYRAYLRIHIRSEHSIIHSLDNFHAKYKVDASEGAREGTGRRCPIHGTTLFTPDMKNTIENCKKKAGEIQDRLPFEEMYKEIPANPNSKHGLSEWRSLRGESNLESYHGALQHYGNTGQKTSLADNLNLEGTTKRNMNKWQQEQLIEMPAEERKKVPAGFEKIPMSYNHSRLHSVNKRAAKVKPGAKPFKRVREMGPDTGEAFFGQYAKQNFGARAGKRQKLPPAVAGFENLSTAVAKNLPPVVAKNLPPAVAAIPTTAPLTASATAASPRDTMVPTLLLDPPTFASRPAPTTVNCSANNNGQQQQQVSNRSTTTTTTQPVYNPYAQPLRCSDWLPLREYERQQHQNQQQRWQQQQQQHMYLQYMTPMQVAQQQQQHRMQRRQRDDGFCCASWSARRNAKKKGRPSYDDHCLDCAFRRV